MMWSRSRLVDVFFFLMIRRPPRSTQSRSSAASDVYKRQPAPAERGLVLHHSGRAAQPTTCPATTRSPPATRPVSYTHLRAHETVLDLVCRLLLEKKKQHIITNLRLPPHIPIPHPFTLYTSPACYVCHFLTLFSLST